MTYRVYDNNKPADCMHHKVDSSWNNSTFEGLTCAQWYASNWLGHWAPQDFKLAPNTPYDYSGHGDILEIREVKD